MPSTALTGHTSRRHATRRDGAAVVCLLCLVALGVPAQQATARADETGTYTVGDRSLAMIRNRDGIAAIYRCQLPSDRTASKWRYEVRCAYGLVGGKGEASGPSTLRGQTLPRARLVSSAKQIEIRPTGPFECAGRPTPGTRCARPARFDRASRRPPRTCRVRGARAHLYSVVGQRQRSAYVVENDKLDVVGDLTTSRGAFYLVRYRAAQGNATVGLVHRGAVDCNSPAPR